MKRTIKGLPLALGLAALCALAGTTAEAQVTATAVLKNGQRHSGTNLAYRVDGRQVIVRTSPAEEPRIPVDQVAYIDFGGTSDPANLNLSGSLEAVVLRDGSVVKGQILELGHTNKADLSSPYLVIVRTEGGEERRLQANQVSRVYFAGGQSSSGSAGTSGGSSSTSPADGQAITVSAQQAWTPTGITVRRGEPLNLEVTGEIKIGGPGATATAAGSSDMNAGNPLPQVPTGALIGRIGNSQPFLIGNQSRIQAPAAGQLFLGINDSNHGDNQGEFRVTVRRVARSR
jgi:hypothetical protein